MAWPFGKRGQTADPLEQGMALYREANALPKERVLYLSGKAVRLYRKAAQSFQKALDADGNNARALYGCGAVQFALGMNANDPFVLSQAQAFCAGALRLGLTDGDERSWSEFIVRMVHDTLRTITLGGLGGTRS